MKRLTFIIGLILVATIAVGAFVFISDRNGENSDYESFTVARNDVTRSVNISGRVQAKQSIALGFEQTGTVKLVKVEVGDEVIKNEELARLNISTLEAQLQEARANINLQEARLAELERGSRPEEIAIKQRQLELAQKVLAQAYDNTFLESRESYTVADNAVRNTVDDLFDNPRSASPQISFPLPTDPGLENSLEFKRLAAEGMLEAWNDLSSASNPTEDQIALIAEDSLNNLTSVRLLLDDAALAVNTVKPTTNITQTTIDGWKSAISTARTNINAQIEVLQTDIQTINTQITTTLQRENELALAENGATKEELDQLKAQVSQAKAAASAIQANISERILKSPREATVTEVYKEAGEVASVNEPVIELITADTYEIVAEIPEIDIAEIMVGQLATLSFDALPDQEFMGQVIAIDPAETIKEGVVIYEVTLAPDNPDPRIRSGMTANIGIQTSKEMDALSIPQRFVDFSNPEGPTVMVEEGEYFNSKTISIGLIGSDKMIHITEGLSEGDTVWFIPSED